MTDSSNPTFYEVIKDDMEMAAKTVLIWLPLIVALSLPLDVKYQGLPRLKKSSGLWMLPGNLGIMNSSLEI